MELINLDLLELKANSTPISVSERIDYTEIKSNLCVNFCQWSGFELGVLCLEVVLRWEIEIVLPVPRAHRWILIDAVWYLISNNLAKRIDCAHCSIHLARRSIILITHFFHLFKRRSSIISVCIISHLLFPVQPFKFLRSCF